MRQALAVLALLLCSITSPLAQFSVNIGVNLPVYPQLVRVPGYPVYYAPQVNSNYFFYDGMYWVYATTTGTRAPGTTVRGSSSRPTSCRFSCCASRSAITAVHPSTSAAGAPTRPRGGAIIGATRGTAAIATGTDGTAVRCPRRRRCLCISVSIRATAIRVPSSR